MTFGKFGYIIMSFAAHLQKSLRSLIKFLGDEYMKYFIKIKEVAFVLAKINIVYNINCI